MNMPSTKEVRYAIDEDEKYAIVTNFYGNECDVMCNDGIARRCVIRAKFKGRCKTDNYIKIGTWILVGVRSWEVRRLDMQKCDLLEVYSDIAKEALKQNVTCDFTALIKANEETTGVVEDEDVVFKDDKTHDYLNEVNIQDANDNMNDEQNNCLDSTLNQDVYEFDLDEI